jgi:mannose-1-phosphate guanylyltransferase / mannose-6-phosphate isomerase
MGGGSGTRMWPESRESLPKQFIPLIGQRSTFQSIVSVSDPAVFGPTVVITNFEYRFHVAEQLREIGAEAVILLEPDRRDSAAALGAAAAWAAARDSKIVVGVLAADHVFADGKQFAALWRAGLRGSRVWRDRHHPATGYGYIHPRAPLAIDRHVRRIERLVEKPDATRARAFIEDGYLWNSGNFVFRADVMLQELQRFEQEIAAATVAAVSAAKKDLGFVVLDHYSFAKAPKTSIDYAVMERTDRAVVLTADVGWSDVGEWSPVWRLTSRDGNSNSLRGRGMVIDSSNVLIRSEEQLIAVIGLKMWSSAPPATRSWSPTDHRLPRLKNSWSASKAQGHPEATEHRRNYRPWGYYQSIDQGSRYQGIVVRPGGRLSLQKHRHRAEHWVVVRGAAEVTLNDKIELVHENESIYLPIGSNHRLAGEDKGENFSRWAFV